MKKDMLLKRLFCVACALLSVFTLWNDLRDLFTGKGADSGILLSLIGLIATGHLFLHPEKLKWKDLGESWGVHLGVFLSVGGILYCLFFLFFGMLAGYPENWKLLCLVSGVIAVIGCFILFPLKLRKREIPEEKTWKRNE